MVNLGNSDDYLLLARSRSHEYKRLSTSFYSVAFISVNFQIPYNFNCFYLIFLYLMLFDFRFFIIQPCGKYRRRTYGGNTLMCCCSIATLLFTSLYQGITSTFTYFYKHFTYIYSVLIFSRSFTN